MVEDKGLDSAVADKVGEYVVRKGGLDLLAALNADSNLVANASAKKGLDDMELLFSYLTSFQVMPNISFDMSLARGLDYYTGVIYEVVTEGSAPSSTEGQTLQRDAKKEKKHKRDAEADDDRSADPSIGVGSIAAGGRYDELVGMFSGKGQIPCVGISFGVDRIFSITKARLEKDKNAAPIRGSEVDVYVMAFGGKGFTGLLKERMEIANLLWTAGLKVWNLIFDSLRAKMRAGSICAFRSEFETPLTRVHSIDRPNSLIKSSQNCLPSLKLLKPITYHSPSSWAKTSLRKVSSKSKNSVYPRVILRRKV